MSTLRGLVLRYVAGPLVLALLLGLALLLVRRSREPVAKPSEERPAEAARIPIAQDEEEQVQLEGPSGETASDSEREPEKREEPDRPPPPPEGYPVPEVKDVRLSSFVNRNLDLSKRIPPDITTRIPKVTGKDIDLVVAVLKDSTEQDVVRNEAANLLHRSGHDGLVPVLSEILADPNEKERFRAYCVQHLWLNWGTVAEDGKESLMSVLHDALSDRHLAVRREALLALVKMRDPKGKEAAVSWLSGPEEKGMRDLAIRCVVDLNLRQQVPALRRCLDDKSESVRVAAIGALSRWEDRASIPAFREAAASNSPRLRRAGLAALRRMNVRP